MFDPNGIEIPAEELEQDEIENEWQDAIYNGERIAIAALVALFNLTEEARETLETDVFDPQGLSDVVYEIHHSQLRTATFEQIRDSFADASVEVLSLQPEGPYDTRLLKLSAMEIALAVKITRAIVSKTIELAKPRIPLQAKEQGPDAVEG